MANQGRDRNRPVRSCARPLPGAGSGPCRISAAGRSDCRPLRLSCAIRIPGAVSDTEDTLGIRYNQITALNSAAIIELHSIVQTSRDAMQRDRDRINELQAENQVLRSRLAERSERDVEIRSVVKRNDDLEQRLLVLEALLIGRTRMSENTESTATP